MGSRFIRSSNETRRIFGGTTLPIVFGLSVIPLNFGTVSTTTRALLQTSTMRRRTT